MSHENHSIWNHWQFSCWFKNLFQIKENIKAPNHWPFMMGIHQILVYSRQTGPVLPKTSIHDVVICQFSLYKSLVIFSLGQWGNTSHVWWDGSFPCLIQHPAVLLFACDRWANDCACHPILLALTQQSAGKDFYKLWYSYKCLQ